MRMRLAISWDPWGSDDEIELYKKMRQNRFFFWGGGSIALHYNKWNAYFVNEFKTMRQFRPQFAVFTWMYARDAEQWRKVGARGRKASGEVSVFV